MVASDGDMIIEGVKGEQYPCKPDVFAASYDEVQDDASQLADARSFAITQAAHLPS
jgi:hypothetical protein